MRQGFLLKLILLIALMTAGCLNGSNFQSVNNNDSLSQTPSEDSDQEEKDNSAQEIRQIAGPATGDANLISGGLKYVVFDYEDRCFGSNHSDVIILDPVSNELRNEVIECVPNTYPILESQVQRIDPTRIKFRNKIYILSDIVDLLRCKTNQLPQVDQQGNWSCQSTQGLSSAGTPSQKLIKCNDSSSNPACTAAAEFDINQPFDELRYFPFLCYDSSGQPTRSPLKFDNGWKYSESFNESSGWKTCNPNKPVIIIDIQGMQGYQSLFNLRCQDHNFQKTFSKTGILNKSEIPRQVSQVLVFLWGGGGSGAASIDWNGNGGQAGGGGGGQARFAVFEVADLATETTITIGRGGELSSFYSVNEPGSSDVFGESGTESKFGDLLIAKPGLGGLEDNFEGLGGSGGGDRYYDYSVSDWNGSPQKFSGGQGGRGQPESSGPGLDGAPSLFGGAGGNGAGKANSSHNISRFGGKGGFHGTYGNANASPGEVPGGGGAAAENGRVGNGADGLAIVMSWCD